jgi:hypothetical protein
MLALRARCATLRRMANWTAAPGFEGLYEVSDEGAVRRVGASVLRPFLRGGYPAVSLKDGPRRQTKAVHLLVMGAFAGPRPANHECAHLDGQAANAAFRNLAWVSKRENEAHKAHPRNGPHWRAVALREAD